MRDNPFSDAFLFVIGSTQDHDSLGGLKWLLVALFLLLVAGSLWIAWRNLTLDPQQGSAGTVATFVCRLMIGCMWFQGSLWKLPLPRSGGFEYWTGQMGEHAAFAFHRELVKAVYLPWLDVIDPLVFLAELAFAVSLMLGIGVRFFALLAVPYCLHLWLGLYRHPAEWPWNYIFLAMVHVWFVVDAAGRSLGLDALLRRRPATGFAGRLVAAVG